MTTQPKLHLKLSHTRSIATKFNQQQAFYDNLPLGTSNWPSGTEIEGKLIFGYAKRALLANWFAVAWKVAIKEWPLDKFAFDFWGDALVMSLFATRFEKSIGPHFGVDARSMIS